ncbi:MAG: zinc ribbon domain-containing protein [Eubacterium sp.]|nr:zinc ribbon domain-containing protein [Eubacterium sp.]
MAGFCYKCGTKVSDNAVFCPSCGAQISNTDSYEKTGQKTKKAVPIIVLSIAAAIFIILVAVAITIINKNNTLMPLTTEIKSETTEKVTEADKTSTEVDEPEYTGKYYYLLKACNGNSYNYDFKQKRVDYEGDTYDIVSGAEQDSVCQLGVYLAPVLYKNKKYYVQDFNLIEEFQSKTRCIKAKFDEEGRVISYTDSVDNEIIAASSDCICNYDKDGKCIKATSHDIGHGKEYNTDYDEYSYIEYEYVDGKVTRLYVYGEFHIYSDIHLEYDKYGRIIRETGTDDILEVKKDIQYIGDNAVYVDEVEIYENPDPEVYAANKYIRLYDENGLCYKITDGEGKVLNTYDYIQVTENGDIIREILASDHKEDEQIIESVLNEIEQ